MMDALLEPVIEAPAELSARLAQGEIHLWYCHLDDPCHDSHLGAYHGLLDVEEQDRAGRFRNARLRRDFCLSHALQRITLANYLDRSAGDLRFETGAFGKPELAEQNGPLPLRFNLSHTKGLAVCAVGRGGAIGIDIEAMNDEASARACLRYFTAPEREAIAYPAPAWQVRFFNRWTLKEACLKACGCGLSPGLDAVTVDNAKSPVTVRFGGGLGLGSEPWRFWLFAPGPEHRCALARCAPGAEGIVKPPVLRLLGQPSTRPWQVIASG